MALLSQTRQADIVIEKSARSLGARMGLVAKTKVAAWKAFIAVMFIAGFAAALTWSVAGDYSFASEAKEPQLCYYHEAELGVVAPPMAIFDDATASRGKFVMAPQGAGDRSGEAALTFSGVAEGAYRLWGRVEGPDGDANSFTVKAAGGDEVEFKFSKGNTWRWEQVDVRGAGRQNGIITVTSTQAIKVTVKSREDGSRLDAMMLLPKSTRPRNNDAGCPGNQPPPPLPPPASVPTVSITARQERIGEDAREGPAEFVVRRTGSDRDRLVVYYVIRGMAVLNEDYRLSPSPVTVPAYVVMRPGNSSAVISLAPIDDRTQEKNEDVTLILARDPSLPTYLVGASMDHAAVAIIDND